MKFFTMKRNKKGFTIIELVVVMAVLAVLVTLGVPRFLGYIKDADVTSMKADASILEGAALEYYINAEMGGEGVWPVDGDPEEAADVEQTTVDLVEIDIMPIDSAKMEDYVRNLSNDFGDYWIVIDGSTSPIQEGEILSRKALEDSSNEDVWVGLYKAGGLEHNEDIEGESWTIE